MTTREFFTAIANGNITENEIAFAKSAIVKLDERNAKRAAKPSKKAIENEPLKAEIKKVLTAQPQTASVIAEKVNLSTQKVSALLRQMEGIAVVDVKVPKKGTQKGYSIQ